MTDGKKGKVAPTGEEHSGEEALINSKMPALPQDQASGPMTGHDASGQLDRWFDAQLTQIYAEVVNEPLPRTFLELLEIRERKPSQ